VVDSGGFLLASVPRRRLRPLDRSPSAAADAARYQCSPATARPMKASNTPHAQAAEQRPQRAGCRRLLPARSARQQPDRDQQHKGAGAVRLADLPLARLPRQRLPVAGRRPAGAGDRPRQRSSSSLRTTMPNGPDPPGTRRTRTSPAAVSSSCCPPTSQRGVRPPYPPIPQGGQSPLPAVPPKRRENAAGSPREDTKGGQTPLRGCSPRGSDPSRRPRPDLERDEDRLEGPPGDRLAAALPQQRHRQGRPGRYDRPSSSSPTSGVTSGIVALRDG
jgi:hypothetical protein